MICPCVSLEMNTLVFLATSHFHKYKGDHIAHVLITSGDNICVEGTYLKFNQGHTLNVCHRTGLNSVPAACNKQVIVVRDNWDMMYSMCQAVSSDLFATPFFQILTWPYRVQVETHILLLKETLESSLTSWANTASCL